MKAELVQLALHKQRLQSRSAAQRQALIRHAQAFQPIFRGVDRIGDGVRWARSHLPVVSALAAFLLVARPRPILRWARRGWLGWQLVRRLQKRIS